MKVANNPFRTINGCWAILLCTLFIFSSQGHALPKKCTDLIVGTKKVVASSADSIQQYYAEARRTWGLRILFVKNPPQKDSPFLERMPHPENSQKAGLRRYLRSVLNYVPQKIGYIITLERDVRFTPIRGLWNLLVDRPIGFVAKQATGETYRSSAPLSFALATGMSLYALAGLDAIDQSAQQSHIVASIEENETSYQYIVDVDYRFADLKAARAKGLISDDDLALLAYVRLDSYRQYEHYLETNENPLSLESEWPHLETPLFSYLKPIFESGVTELTGFDVPEQAKGPLSEKQMLDLFYFTHLRYLEYQFIEDVFIFKKYGLKSSQIPEKYLGLQKSYLESDFVQELLKSGLPKDRIVYYLMERAHWKNLFANWSTLEIAKFKRGENGVLTSDHLTLSDIETEMLEEARHGL